MARVNGLRGNPPWGDGRRVTTHLRPSIPNRATLYSGEGARIFLPYAVAGDFDFSCQFNLPDNSNGAGGPVIYFRGQADGSLYAFRYINYWGTAVLQKKLPGQPWVQIGYATGRDLAVGQWHDLRPPVSRRHGIAFR